MGDFKEDSACIEQCELWEIKNMLLASWYGNACLIDASMHKYVFPEIGARHLRTINIVEKRGKEIADIWK